FNGGRVLGEMGCAELVAEMNGGRRLLEPEHMLPVTKKQTLTRMLSNPLGIIERILLLQPNSSAHVRDHGLLLALVGQTAQAIATLERYLKMEPAAADADLVREQIK